jgi:serine/threonine protein kinase
MKSARSSAWAGWARCIARRDTRLGRDVAIKILPSAFTSDRSRRERFEREARVLASLNHPNIAAIYGVEEHGDVRGLVLEVVEGDTLADRLARTTAASGRGVPVPEVLAIARQIADALDAAHEKGIVHRDLKPANIKVTAAGVVKVLDFGLAKAVADEEAHAREHALTAPRDADTRTGVVMGTAAYMSPEQAKGEKVDKRTDIWAFGCLLFELLAGRPAFARASGAETIAAVLHREPDWSGLPADSAPTSRRMACT